MDIEIHLLVWNELKEHFAGNDAEDAAEDFVRVLVEHGADAEEIAEFAIDSNVKSALQEYVELEPEEVDDEYDDDEDNIYA